MSSKARADMHCCIPNGIPLDGSVLVKSGEEITIGVSGASDEDDGDIGRIGAAYLAAN